MTQNDSTSERLTEMECKFAFQQETIEALNAQVTKQWAVIDQLTKKLDRMTDQVLSIEDNMDDARNEPPPPHY